jgi:hypothetical protein
VTGREIPEAVTRVTIVGDGVREYWSDYWTVSVQDDGRTVKLFAEGDGKAAKEERDAALGAELSARFQRPFCNRCGAPQPIGHDCLRDKETS